MSRSFLWGQSSSMSKELVTIASFGTVAEAHAARSLLDSHGILAFVANEETNTALFHVGTALGGVKLETASTDAEQAIEILEAAAADDAAQSSPWLCSPCNEEVEAGFDLCWSCGGQRDEVADPNYLPESRPTVVEKSDNEFAPPLEEELLADVPDHAKGNPYASPAVAETADQPDETRPVSDETEKAAIRAMRTAVIGVVLCPPLLSLYSMWLIVKIGLSGETLSSKAARNLYLALAINAVIMSGVLYFVVLFSRDGIVVPVY